MTVYLLAGDNTNSLVLYQCLHKYILPSPLLTPTACNCISPRLGWTWAGAPSCTESSGRWSAPSSPHLGSCNPSGQSALSQGSPGSGSHFSESGLAPGAARLSYQSIQAVSSQARSRSHICLAQRSDPALRIFPSSAPLSPPCLTCGYSVRIQVSQSGWFVL